MKKIVEGCFHSLELAVFFVLIHSSVIKVVPPLGVYLYLPSPNFTSGFHISSLFRPGYGLKYKTSEWIKRI
jgi:hypothetical protein